MALAVEERDQGSSYGGAVEFVLVGVAVLLDEFEENGQVVGPGPSDGDVELVQPTTSMRTISIT